MGKPKYKKFYPEKVYRCTCLARVIAFRLVNEIYSLVDICVKVNQTIREKYIVLNVVKINKMLFLAVLITSLW